MDVAWVSKPSHGSSYTQGTWVHESGSPLTETTWWWQEVGPPWIIAADWIAILGQPSGHLLVPWESGVRSPTGEAPAPARPGPRSGVCYLWCHLWTRAKLCIIWYADWLYQSHSVTHSCRNIKNVHRSSINAMHTLIQFKVVHRLHFSPTRLHEISKDTSPLCEKCLWKRIKELCRINYYSVICCKLLVVIC